MTFHADRLTRALQALLLPFALLFLVVGCATPAIRSTADKPLTAAEQTQLWMNPGDITARDLFFGPGGKQRAPDPRATYKVLAFDASGNSKGYDVQDPQGREWKIKVGEEVQPEIVASRLLWAIGFHQPATYVVPILKLDGGRYEDNGGFARLRFKEGHKSAGDWSWHQNPFVGTRPLKGLLVANLIMNNWDLKSTQNRIYLMDDSEPEPSRRYVVQDLGAAFGKSRWPTGSKSKIDDFESQNLIRRVHANAIDFDYHARHKELFKDITLADVAWTCRLFARLSDQQWDDAFRAGGYTEDVRRRYIAKLKSKVQEGLAPERRAAATR